MSFFIVSGLSGSGKSIVLQALEDLGFYCIDNLPAPLLPHFADLVINPKVKNLNNAAVGIDARNRFFLDAAPEALEKLEASGIKYRIIFLEAEESVLVTRFKETRRKHPLTDQDTPLLEGIRLERQLLEPLSDRATRRIDTTHTSPHQLRRQIHDFARANDTAGLTILFESFGYKHGSPLDADFVFDVRCLPNPYWRSELRRYTGMDEPVVTFLEGHEEVQQMFEDLKTFLEAWLPRFEKENRSYLTVAIGCTGGLHRSVYLAQRLAQHFNRKGIKTQVRHRELA